MKRGERYTFGNRPHVSYAFDDVGIALYLRCRDAEESMRERATA